MSQNQEMSACALCETTEQLLPYTVAGIPADAQSHISICQNCSDQLSGIKEMDTNHWKCLESSMWSTTPAVQVMAWRLLTFYRAEGWAQELLDILYIEEPTLTWAKSQSFGTNTKSAEKLTHKDSNGTILQSGDSVLLIKDLDVKGGGFTAKRGTLVRNVMLVENNSEQLEGRVNGQEIVILTKFVKKA